VDSYIIWMRPSRCENDHVVDFGSIVVDPMNQHIGLLFEDKFS
jgi:hypothetical protein